MYSKAFYTYMTIICQGSAGKHDNLAEFKDELTTLIHKQGQKVSPSTQRPSRTNRRQHLSCYYNSCFPHFQQNFIVALIQNHLGKLDESRAGEVAYWRLLTFEILFLWSILTNIQNEYLAVIVNGKSIIER